MALWGISTTTETAENNYGIPKFLKDVDRNHTPHNCFADNRGWIYRHYGDNIYSGLSTSYYDEILVPVAGLNTTSAVSTASSIGLNPTGLGLANQVAVFFADPNNSSIISVGGGATSGISTGAIGEIHLVFNETVYAGAGTTILINTFNPNQVLQASTIVATATSVGSPVQVNIPGIGQTVLTYNGQISNRIAFKFTAPSTLLSANVNFLTTGVSTTVSIGSTTIFVSSSSGVSIGSSVSVAGVAITNRTVTGVGLTFINIGSGSTIASTISTGSTVTFSTLTNRTFLGISSAKAFTGIITDAYDGVGVSSTYNSELLRNIAGAGTTSGVGIGTTRLFVKP
jgi:hypothetical protein